jgi:hypothetical protein
MNQFEDQIKRIKRIESALAAMDMAIGEIKNTISGMRVEASAPLNKLLESRCKTCSFHACCGLYFDENLVFRCDWYQEESQQPAESDLEQRRILDRSEKGESND